MRARVYMKTKIMIHIQLIFDPWPAQTFPFSPKLTR